MNYYASRITELPCQGTVAIERLALDPLVWTGKACRERARKCVQFIHIVAGVEIFRYYNPKRGVVDRHEVRRSEDYCISGY